MLETLALLENSALGGKTRTSFSEDSIFVSAIDATFHRRRIGGVDFGEARETTPCQQHDATRLSRAKLTFKQCSTQASPVHIDWRFSACGREWPVPLILGLAFDSDGIGF